MKIPEFQFDGAGLAGQYLAFSRFFAGSLGSNYLFQPNGVLPMQEVTVPKEELLRIVRANREKHHQIFLEAMDGYRKRAIEILDRMIADAKQGKKFETTVGLVQPLDQTKEYDQAIRMLEMSVDENVQLDSRSFAQLVMNQWSWSGRFSSSNKAYLASSESVSYLDSLEQE